MGKKKKAKKKEKGTRKKSENVLDGISGLPADGLLLALLLQGKKQSLAWYYGSYLTYKESLKELRMKLDMIEITNYNKLKSLNKSTDEVTFELMIKEKERFLASLNVDHDALICLQRSEINELQTMVDALEASAEDLDNQLEDIKQFQETNGFEQLQKEIECAKKDAEEAKQRRIKHLEKLSQRHEQSLFLSSQKAQRIIADMETVACKVIEDTKKRLNSVNCQQILLKR
jgi:DNA segregation ATPase FtsK/SpoIIIE-like protein